MLEILPGDETDFYIEYSIFIKKVKPWDLVLLKGVPTLQYYDSLMDTKKIVSWQSRSTGLFKFVLEAR